MLAAPLFGQPPAPVPAPQADDATLDERAAALARPLIEGGAVPGLVIGLVDDEGSEHRLSLGTVETGKERAPDADTLFEIGSISKVFTSVLLAQMVEQGELKFTTPVQSLLPEGTVMPMRKRPIVLGDLTTHTSGLPRLPSNLDLSPAHANDPYAPYNEALLVEFLSTYKPVVAPGRYDYSNLGAGLLGHVLSRHAGAPYAELLRERIFVPLGMNHARVGLMGDHGLAVAMPHAWGDEPSHAWTFDVLAGAGGVCATMNDMLKFARAAANADLASVLGDQHAALARAMKKSIEPAPWVDPARAGMKMGLGWHFDDKDRVWHNGGTGGFASCMVIDPASGRIAIVLANAAAHDQVTALGFQLADLLAGEDPVPQSIRAAASLSEAQAQRWVGRYQLAPAIEIAVTREGTRAYVQLTGQERYRLFAHDDSRGFLRVVEAELEFELAGDEGSPASAVTLVQNGARQRAARVEEGAGQ